MPDWKSYYQALPDGRYKIAQTTLVAFGKSHRDRLLDIRLWGRPATVLLLDKPLKLGDKVFETDADELFLRRVRLHELPGWPPKVAPTGDPRDPPDLLDLTLKEAVFNPGRCGLALTLEYRGRPFQAWHLDCPAVLLKCVEATLNQEGALGRKLSDLHDIRLIGQD